MFWTFRLAFRKFLIFTLRFYACKSQVTLRAYDYTFRVWRSRRDVLCYGESVMIEQEKVVSQWSPWHTIKLMCNCQETFKCKSLAVIWMADTEVCWVKRWWFCVHTSVCSVGLLNKICSLSSMRFNIFFPLPIQPLLMTLILKELQVQWRGREAETLKCFSIWRANGWSVCYQRSGVVCWKILQKQEKSVGQMCTGRNADTLSRSLMFTLVISNLPGISLSVHISSQRACILLTLK